MQKKTEESSVVESSTQGEAIPLAKTRGVQTHDLQPVLDRLATLESQVAVLKHALKDFYDVEGKGSVG